MSCRSIGNGCSSIPIRGSPPSIELVIPAGTPVEFRLTSATVMNSFFVPQLGSQIYTMAGMTTHLNLLADRPGEYPGISANFSGDGFSDMRFIVKAVPAGDFDAWVAQARGAGVRLDDAGYAAAGKTEQRRAAGDLSLGRPEAVRAHRRPDGVGPRKGRHWRRRGVRRYDRREVECSAG